MEFHELIIDLRASSEKLHGEYVDRSLISSVYCNQACKAVDKIAESSEYDSVITGLWLIVDNFAEQLGYLKPVPALSELCYKLFRQCAKSVLNIQWQNLEEDGTLRQNFLTSLANLHAKLSPFDFPRFRLLDALTESPWTNPTLAKVMGGEIEDIDKKEVQAYIEQEDPIILQLRVDMMLKENCEEYALNLCNSCLTHPELQTDLTIRKIQLSLLYKLGHEDKLQEECQKLSIHDALRIIKELQISEPHRQLCTVLAQTFMVQNWIRPSDMEANKELLRLWIRQQLLVDREQDKFKDSVWAMAKLSQSTDQIVVFIDVLREECGDIYLQLYIDMCVFAINVDKGQMETSIRENNLIAAVARRSDMASVCAKLSCLCHHTSLKVARICALTSFALRPSDQSFSKIGTFYGQNGGCCKKCGTEKIHEPGKVNPATLYEVERLLNMLRPEYLNPDQNFVNIQALCRRFLHESLKNAELKKQESVVSVLSSTMEDSKKKIIPSLKPTNLFEALLPQDVQNNQLLLNRMRLQNISTSSTQSVTLVSKPNILGHNSGARQQYMFDAEKVKNSLPYGIPMEHQYYLNKHEKEQEQRNKNSQKKRDAKALETSSSTPQQILRTTNQKNNGKQAAQLSRPEQIQNSQLSLINSALQQDPHALQKLSQTRPDILQAVIELMKNKALTPHQQSQCAPQVSQPLPTVSTLLKPTTQTPKPQSPPRRYPRPQLYAQPINISTSNVDLNSSCPPVKITSQAAAKSLDLPPTYNVNVISTIIPSQKQRTDNALQFKNQTISIRQFTPMQGSTVQQKQISEMHHLSGSTVTVNTSSTSGSGTFNVPNIRQSKTTVQLAEAAALAKLQSKTMVYQPNHSHGYVVNKSNPQQFITSLPPSSHLQPQKQLVQSSANVVSVQYSATPSTNSQNVSLPSSDELSGSIVGIDDTIIRELLMEDSGILANTFPDIEPDIVGDDKPRKISEITLVTTVNNAIQSLDSSRRAYTSVTAVDSLRSTVSQPKQSTSQVCYSADRTNQHFLSTSQSKNIYTQHTVITANQVQPSLLSSATLKSETISSQALNNSLGRSSQPAHQQEHRETKDSTSLKENVKVFSSLDNLKPSVQQLREQMKKEQIEGEIFMDSANNATYRCIICSLAFETLDFLREHVRNVCKPGLQSSSVYNTKIKQDRANSAKAGLETTTVFQCLRCFELCVSDAGIKEHRLTCKRVPTVPSDLKKETANKNKTATKSGRATPKKEMRDNSYVVPEMPLPFPYPSLNTEAVLQSLAMAGKSALSSSNCGTSKAQSSHFISKPQISNAPSVTVSAVHNIATTIKAPDTFFISNSSNKVHLSESLQGHVPTISNITMNLVTTVAKNPGMNTFQCTTASSASYKSTYSSTFNHSAGTHLVNLSQTAPPSYTNGRMETKDTCRTIESLSVSNSSYNLIVSSGAIATSAHSIQTTTFNSTKPMPQAYVNASLTAPMSKVNNLDIVQTEPTISSKFAKNSGDCPAGTSTTTLQQKKEVPPKKARSRVKQLPPPSFTEISRSGGSKFYKCNLCSQTLCSLENFEVHWKECATKNKTLLKRRASRDKLVNMKPPTEEMLQNLSTVIAMVATGGGAVEDVHFDNDDWSDTDLLLLEDPCEEDSFKPNALKSDSVYGIDEDEELSNSYKNTGNEKDVANRTRIHRENAQEDSEETGEKTSSSASEIESEGSSLSCKVCQTVCQNKRMLLQHFAGKHLKPFTIEKGTSEATLYICHLCQKNFPNFMHYMQHVPDHSVTIYEKMKAFLAKKRFAHKNILSLNIAKALQSKKAAKKSALDKLKRELLSSNTKAIREKLRLAKKKRLIELTSSEDDNSSDKKSESLEETASNFPTVLLKRGRGRPRKQESVEDTSSTERSSSKLSSTRDEDYMVSDDIDSDSLEPPTTRSKNLQVKRKAKTSESNSASDSTQELKSSQNNIKGQSIKTCHFEAGCNYLTFLEQDDGHLVVKQDTVCLKNSINNLVEDGEKKEENTLPRTITVHSLNRQQMDALSNCNLYPKICLKNLTAEDIENCVHKIKHKFINKENLKAVESAQSNPSYFDSYLNYCRQYIAQSGVEDSAAPKCDVSFNSSASTDFGSSVSTDGSTISYGLNTDREDSLDAATSKLSSTSADLKTILSKFPTRRCSVNLGKKVDPNQLPILSDENKAPELVGTMICEEGVSSTQDIDLVSSGNSIFNSVPVLLLNENLKGNTKAGQVLDSLIELDVDMVVENIDTSDSLTSSYKETSPVKNGSNSYDDTVLVEGEDDMCDDQFPRNVHCEDKKDNLSSDSEEIKEGEDFYIVKEFSDDEIEDDESSVDEQSIESKSLTNVEDTAGNDSTTDEKSALTCVKSQEACVQQTTKLLQVSSDEKQLEQKQALLIQEDPLTVNSNSLGEKTNMSQTSSTIIIQNIDEHRENEKNAHIKDPSSETDIDSTKVPNQPGNKLLPSETRHNLDYLSEDVSNCIDLCQIPVQEQGVLVSKVICADFIDQKSTSIHNIACVQDNQLHINHNLEQENLSIQKSSCCFENDEVLESTNQQNHIASFNENPLLDDKIVTNTILQVNNGIEFPEKVVQQDSVQIMNSATASKDYYQQESECKTDALTPGNMYCKEKSLKNDSIKLAISIVKDENISMDKSGGQNDVLGVAQQIPQEAATIDKELNMITIQPNVETDCMVDDTWNSKLYLVPDVKAMHQIKNESKSEIPFTMLQSIHELSQEDTLKKCECKSHNSIPENCEVYSLNDINTSLNVSADSSNDINTSSVVPMDINTNSVVPLNIDTISIFSVDSSNDINTSSIVPVSHDNHSHIPQFESTENCGTRENQSRSNLNNSDANSEDMVTQTETAIQSNANHSTVIEQLSSKIENNCQAITSQSSIDERITCNGVGGCRNKNSQCRKCDPKFSLAAFIAQRLLGDNESTTCDAESSSENEAQTVEDKKNCDNTLVISNSIHENNGSNYTTKLESKNICLNSMDTEVLTSESSLEMSLVRDHKQSSLNLFLDGTLIPDINLGLVDYSSSEDEESVSKANINNTNLNTIPGNCEINVNVVLSAYEVQTPQMIYQPHKDMGNTLASIAILNRETVPCDQDLLKATLIESNELRSSSNNFNNVSSPSNSIDCVTGFHSGEDDVEKKELKTSLFIGDSRKADENTSLFDRIVSQQCDVDYKNNFGEELEAPFTKTEPQTTLIAVIEPQTILSAELEPQTTFSTITEPRITLKDEKQGKDQLTLNDVADSKKAFDAVLDCDTNMILTISDVGDIKSATNLAVACDLKLVSESSSFTDEVNLLSPMLLEDKELNDDINTLSTPNSPKNCLTITPLLEDVISEEMCQENPLAIGNEIKHRNNENIDTDIIASSILEKKTGKELEVKSIAINIAYLESAKKETLNKTEIVQHFELKDLKEHPEIYKASPDTTHRDLQDVWVSTSSEQSDLNTNGALTTTKLSSDLTNHDQAIADPLDQPDCNITVKETEKEGVNDEKHLKENLAASDGEDSDNLSDFDLVIEEDTSARNIVSYKMEVEKKIKPVSKPMMKVYEDTKTEYPTLSSEIKTSKKEMAKLCTKSLQSSSKVNSNFSQNLTGDLSPRKPLAGAKSLKNQNREQFVWDVDDDEEDNDKLAMKHKSINISLRTKSSLSATEAVKRKRNALREKSESSPFTWDVEESATEKIAPLINQENKMKLMIQTSTAEVTPRYKSQRIIKKKRSFSPDFISSRNMATKTNLTTKREKKGENKKSKDLLMNIESPFAVLENSDNSITVDEEISFKINSYSSPLLHSIDSISSSGSSPCKRGRPKSKKFSQESSASNGTLNDAKCSLITANEKILPKIVESLKIRHSSIDSNKSDSSSSSKWLVDPTCQGSPKRFKKSCDPLKAGLIRIAPTPSTVKPTLEGATAPTTRSSEAAMKAMNQKNLRNRGVSSSPEVKNVKTLKSPKCISDCNIKTSKNVNSVSPLEKAVVKRRNPSAPPVPSKKPRLKAGAVIKGNGTMTSSTAVIIVDPAPQPLRGNSKKSPLPSAEKKKILTQLLPGATSKPSTANKHSRLKVDKSVKPCKVKYQKKKT